jgi:hypothetical protein
MIVARTAARTALLALAAKLHCPADPDIRTLVELASSPQPHSGVVSDAQKAQARAMLAAVVRLLGPATQAISVLQPPRWVEEGSFPKGSAVRNRTDGHQRSC